MSVLKPTMTLLQNKSVYWADIKKTISAAQFLNKLKTIDCDTMPPKALRNANKAVQATNFNAKYMRSKSKECGEMCRWVVAVVDSANHSQEA